MTQPMDEPVPRVKLWLYIPNDLYAWIRSEARREGLTSTAWTRRLLLRQRQAVEAKRNGVLDR